MIQEKYPISVPYFSATHFSHGLIMGWTRSSGMTRWWLIAWATARPKTPSDVVIYILQRYKEHLTLKSYQIIVLAPNFLMMAENGCRLGGKCYLSRQGRRESLTSRDASSPSSAVYSAPFNLNLLSLRSKSLQISARFQGVISQKKTPIFSHCLHKL